MRHKMVGGLLVVALVALGGCTNGQSAPATTHPATTASDATACTEFSTQFVKHAATLGTQEVKTVAAALESASNTQLRSEGAALKDDVAKGDTSTLQADAKKVSATCFNLGLTDHQGNPTQSG